MPKRAAINFHDSPLPKYAGLQATSWAIQNQETEFGVTWHQMLDKIDAGAIFKQVKFPIEPDETNFSLSAKCYEKGKESFFELIKELKENKEQPYEQDTSQRSVFLSSKRPESVGIIDWNQSAEKISALIRGLSYQPDPNPLCTPKIKIGNRYYLVQEASASATSENESRARNHS